MRRQTGKSFTNNPNTEKILNAFYQETSYEMECDKICGQKHRTLGGHTEYIKKGGCNKLINVLTDISSLQ